MFTESTVLGLREAILQAGDAILEIYGEDDFSTQFKADASPVTAADLAADEVIYNYLSKAFPDEVIVTEERSGNHDQAAHSFFIVDPLDGTKEFVKRGGDFTVNIGYVKDGAPVFGMVYAPAIGRLFFTMKGCAFEEVAPFEKGAFSELREIRVAQSDNSALRVVASKSHRDAATDDYIGEYQVADFRSAGSSLKFCLVASGEADFYPRLGPTMEWDTAAADALTRAAGGMVLDFETKAPLAYGKAGFRNPFFLVLSPSVELKG